MMKVTYYLKKKNIYFIFIQHWTIGRYITLTTSYSPQSLLFITLDYLRFRYKVLNQELVSKKGVKNTALNIRRFYVFKMKVLLLTALPGTFYDIKIYNIQSSYVTTYGKHIYIIKL